MKKKLVAMLLTAALVMTNSGFVYAAEMGNIATRENQKTEKSDLAEKDQGSEEEQKNPVVQEKNEEEPVQSMPEEQSVQPEDYRETVQVQSVQGDFEYTVSDGTVTITKYTGTGGDVTVPETIDGMAVTVIGESAFAEHTDVTRVAMPDNVTEVRSNAFANCTALNKINLPSGLTYLGHSAFWSCTSLTEIEIPASLEKTANEYDYMGPFAQSGLKEVIFEEGTTQIAERLFKDCAALEEVIIPDSVTEIETEAFYKCTGLKSVEFGKNVEVIWNGAFRECTGLVQVKLPDTVTRIEQDAFAGDTALNKVNLPSGLTYLGHSAFWSCTSLTEIKIPASLEKTANEYDYMGPFAQSGLKEVTFEEGTTQIAERLFKDCAALEEVIIPDSVTEIETEAFYKCTGLKSVEFGKNVEVIWNGAFRECTGLVQVKLPDTVTRIEQDAFAGDTALNKVNLPSGLTYLGHSAFWSCTSLTEIKIPASLEKTANEYDYTGPFAQSGLKEVTFEEGTTQIAERLFKDCAALEEVIIPDSVTEIETEAFYKCTGLKSVEFGKNVEVIWNGAFRECTGLVQVKLPDTVTRIEQDAFAGDTALNKVNLPSGLTYLGHSAFWSCTSLTEIKIPASLEKTANEYDYTGPFAQSGLKEVTFEEGTTQIAERLFKDCAALEEVIIPDSVTEIETEAFYKCTGLKSVEFGKNVEVIWNGAFRECTGLVQVELPDTVTRIEQDAFAGDTALNKINLPSGLTYLGHSAFWSCTSLTEIEIPASLEKTANEYDYTGPFAQSGLKKVAFEEGTTQIAERLFKEADYLTAVTIPNTVETIGVEAFRGCDSLLSVALGDSIQKINSDAFADCPNLSLYTSYGTKSHIYAIENNISVKLTSYAYDDFDGLAIQEGCEYSVDYNSLNTSGYASAKLHYEIDKNVFSQSKETYISFYLPEDAEVYQETIRINGNLGYDYTIEGRKFSVPITETEGDITYGFAPASVEALSTAAIYEYDLNGELKKELLGFDNSSRSFLTINCDSVISNPTFTVRGIGDKSTEIVLYINDTIAATVMTSKTGSYQAELTLQNPMNDISYVVKAQNAANDQQTAQTTIRYDDTAPYLTEFKLYYNNHRNTVIDLLNTETKPYISFNPNVPFTFVTQFENSEEIDNVYIVSTRNNERKIMPAEYNESTGQYIASGYFDDNNHSYVPGTLTVEYNCSQEEIKAGQEVDWQGMYNSLSEDMKKTKITTVEENGETHYRMDLSEVSDELKDVVIDYVISSIDEETGADVSGWLEGYEDIFNLGGYLVPGLDGETYIGASHSDPKEYLLVIAKDFSNLGKGAVKIKVKLQGESWSKWSDVAPKIGAIASGLSAASDIYNFDKERDQLIDEINQSPNIRDKSEAIRKADQLFEDQKMYTVMAATLPLLVSMMGVSAPVTLGFTALLGMIGALSGFFWDARVNNIKGEEIGIRWGIDPSGYVYEAVEQNRLEGVTVTAYYKENAEDTEAVLWDASEYEQQNPLLTDSSGAYAWDVPEGLWQVKYEKEGYETAYSDWLPVPPPQTEVNIGLISKEKPVIESVSVYADHADVVFSKYMVPDTVSSIKLFDAGGREVPYTLEYDKESVNAEGVNYAQEYRLNFSGSSILTPESSCQLTVDSTVKSYADVAMDPAEVTASVHKNLEIIAPDNVTVKMGEMGDIPVKVANAEEGTSFEAVSGFEAIVSVSEVSDTGIKVAGHMYGEADVAITIPGTDVKKTIRVTVGKETGETEIRPTVVLPQSAYTMRRGEKLTIEPELYPDNDTLTGSWSIISGEDIVKMDGNTATALKKGEAVLRYTLAGEEAYAECRIIVDSDSGDPETPPEPDTPEFTDVHEGDWFYDSVQYVSKNKLMTGLNETTFGPYDFLARAQFAVILHRMNGEPEMPYSPRFHDVSAGLWYTDAILWAADTAVVTGYTNGNFGPGDNINREQMALMMYRYANHKGHDTSARADFSSYQDASMVSDFAEEAMQWAVGEKIITGKYNETQLDPKGNASRAECATIIMRFVEKYGK